MVKVVLYHKYGKKYYKFQMHGGTNPLTGKRITIKKANFASRQAARVAIARIQQKIYEDGYYRPGTYNKEETFQDVANDWYESWLKSEPKASTQHGTRDAIRRYLYPELGNMLISRIKPGELQKVVDELTERLVNFKTICGLLRRIFDYAYKHEYIDSNPFNHVTISSKNKRRNKLNSDVLTKDELKEYLKIMHDECRPPVFMFFFLLSRTGLRKGEALALSWSDFKDDNLSITKTISRDEDGNEIISDTPKTESSNRIITLDTSTVHMLTRWKLKDRGYLMTHHAKSDLIFPSYYRGKIKVYNRDWPNWELRKIQKNHPTLKVVDVHGFRHTYATLALEAGVSIRDLQHMLGHSNFNITLSTYAAYTQKEHKQAAAKMERYFSNW